MMIFTEPISLRSPLSFSIVTWQICICDLTPHFQENGNGKKNVHSMSRLLRECPRPELQNEPRLDSLEIPSPIPFMASLWIGSGEGLTIKGFEDPGYQVGAHFEALDEGVLVSALKATGYFFPISIALEVR